MPANSARSIVAVKSHAAAANVSTAKPVMHEVLACMHMSCVCSGCGIDFLQK